MKLITEDVLVNLAKNLRLNIDIIHEVLDK